MDGLGTTFLVGFFGVLGDLVDITKKIMFYDLDVDLMLEY